MPFDLMAYAIGQWYTRSYPACPKRRAEEIANELNIEPDALYEACQEDFAQCAEAD